jgi:hypothetical protein
LGANKVPHILNDISDKIPANTRKIYSLLSGESLWLREKWVNYNYLYGHSQERIEILNKAGSTFFYILDHLFIDDLILSLSRLTDLGEKRGSNFSLEQLIIKLDQKAHADLIQKLKPLFEDLREKTFNIRKHRNKRIAHSDLNVAIMPDDLLPPVSRKLIEQVLVQIEGFLNAFNCYFTNATMIHDALSIHCGSDILFSKLLRAQAYELLEKQGVIPHGYWRKQKGVAKIL